MIEFRKATEADVPFLLRLRRESMGGHLAVAGVAWDDATQRARLLDRFECAMIVTWNREDIGLFKVARDMDPWELLQIQLQATHQRLGIGGALIEGLIRDAEAAGVGVVLRVLKANPARELYERLGFRTIDSYARGYLMRHDATL